MMRTRDILRVYDFIRSFTKMEPDAVQAFLEEHVNHGQIVFEERDGEVVGAAAFWHISDPHDTNGSLKRADESPSGKYIYLPFLLVSKHKRGELGILRALLSQCARRCPTAERFAFRRLSAPKRRKRFGTRHPERVHVIGV